MQHYYLGSIITAALHHSAAIRIQFIDKNTQLNILFELVALQLRKIEI